MMDWMWNGRRGRGDVTRISEITGKNADVPADETNIVAVAVMPTTNDG
jgi:hypothetical protein